MRAAFTEDLERAYGEHRQLLWDVCFRMTGVAADADELVQETFVRAAARPPPRGPLKAWLLKVAMNLARDHLRARRRRSYVGPWLPGLVELPETEALAAPASDGPGHGYDLRESATVGFLLALEALTPGQRAVLLLTEVFDASVKEVAQALAMTENAVKVAHHRARKAMAAYDRSRTPLTPERRARSRAALETFLGAVASGDLAAARALLAPDVRAVTDGAGEFHQAINVVEGAPRVLRLLAGLAKKQRTPLAVRWLQLNGEPALEVELPPMHDPKLATRYVLRAELDASGRISELHTVYAARKLPSVSQPR